MSGRGVEGKGPMEGLAERSERVRSCFELGIYGCAWVTKKRLDDQSITHGHFTRKNRFDFHLNLGDVQVEVHVHWRGNHRQYSGDLDACVHTWVYHVLVLVFDLDLDNFDIIFALLFRRVPVLHSR